MIGWIWLIVFVGVGVAVYAGFKRLFGHRRPNAPARVDPTKPRRTPDGRQPSKPPTRPEKPSSPPVPGEPVEPHVPRDRPRRRRK